MIQIRQSVFETNSSSVHSICVSKETISIDQIPDTICFKLSSYGWEEACVDDTASYLYTAIHQLSDRDLAGIYLCRLKAYLQNHGIEASFDNSYEEHCYLDHSDILIDFLDELTQDDDKLTRFLFGRKSCIYTGNDGSGEQEDMLYCARDTILEDGSWKIVPNPNHDETKFEYFLKDN